jgi:hypothetical protein
MAVEGTLDLFKLPEILQLISQQKKTGILTVQGQQDIIAISFLNGQIVAADALSQTVEEGLSQVLVSEGLISATDFSRATAEHQAAGGRLLDLLVERRYVPRPQLLQALRLQTYRQLEQLLGWAEGDFKFYSGDEVSYEEGFAPISVEEFLVNSLPGLRNAQAAAASAQAPAPARPVPAPPAAVPPAGARPAAPAPAARPAAAPPPTGPGPAAPGLRVVRGGPAPATGVVRPVPAASPEPAPKAFRKMTVEGAAVPAPYRLLPTGLAGVLALVLLATLLLSPGALLLPFPWQEGERAALAKEQRAALYRKIDRGSKTFFLLEGRFPEQLGLLVSSGLLSPGDLRDPQGYPLQYTASEESYTLQPMVDGKPLAGAESTEAITGNFLLDPEFVSVSKAKTGEPLVLLD